VVGDAAELRWHDAILRDEFGAPITKTSWKQVAIHKINDMYNPVPPQLQLILDTHTDNSSIGPALLTAAIAYKLYSNGPSATILPSEYELRNALLGLRSIVVNIPNPNHNTSLEYVPRSQRKEWSAVGILGKLRVRDNGSCIVGGLCSCQDGIAIPGDTWYVLKRVSATVIEIAFPR
jgi:hypothetical protein